MLKNDFYLADDYLLAPENDALKRIPYGEMDDEYKQLLALCKESLRDDERSVAISIGENRYRASVIHSQDGVSYCCRRFDNEAKSLKELRINSFYINHLMDVKTGVVLVCGETSSGKTTTCTGFVHDYMKAHGGIAVTIEDPVEILMEGFYSNYAIYQIEAKKHGGYTSAMRDVVRMSPSLIFFGEVRDAETAVEVIKAGTNGHLVVATIHADDPITALTRLNSLTGGIFGQMANGTIADGIAIVFGQELIKIPGNILQPKNKMLSFIGEHEGNRNLVRNNQTHQLVSSMERLRVQAQYDRE